MDEIVSAANEFNSAIKFLARAYLSKKKGTFEEEKAVRNNKRLAILIASDPIWLIENSGPYFLTYAAEIKEGKWATLMNMEFAEEKKRYKQSVDGSAHSYAAMDDKILFIKRVFNECDKDEREAMIECTQTLLSSYCRYALGVKAKAAKK